MKSFFFKRLYIVLMLILGLISLVLLLDKTRTGLILNILEGLNIVYCGGALLWARSKRIDSIVVIRWVTILYILLSYIYAVLIRGANVLDFLMIYKSFVYITLLTFLANKRLMEARHILVFFDLILILFFVKYLAIVGLGLGTRPVVYEENNFELMLLYALYLVRYSITKEKLLMYLGFVGVITVISLSRSSLIMYSFLGAYVYYKSYKKTWIFVLPVLGVIMGGVMLYIFAQRSAASGSSNLEDIDRYRFFLLFLTEVKNWNVFDWLVGAERITPLSYITCAQMSFWNRLFSFSGDGTCYSVILHSFLIRVILDHGLLGLFFMLYATYQLIVKSGVDKWIAYVFLIIVVLNGLSVSSFNNLFFAISMVFLMVTNRYLPEKNAQIISQNY